MSHCTGWTVVLFFSSFLPTSIIFLFPRLCLVGGKTSHKTLRMLDGLPSGSSVSVFLFTKDRGTEAESYSRSYHSTPPQLAIRGGLELGSYTLCPFPLRVMLAKGRGSEKGACWLLVALQGRRETKGSPSRVSSHFPWRDDTAESPSIQADWQ